MAEFLFENHGKAEGLNYSGNVGFDAKIINYGELGKVFAENNISIEALREFRENARLLQIETNPKEIKTLYEKIKPLAGLIPGASVFMPIAETIENFIPDIKKLATNCISNIDNYLSNKTEK